MNDTITHEKTPDTHSSIVGGSSASRILGCPGSVDLLAKIPEAVLNESSTYADEGTGLHEIMAYLVENNVDINTLINDPKVDELWANYKLHDDRFYDAVVPAYRAFNAFCDELLDGEPEDAELLIRVESKVEMPGIDGAFGTCDILIKAPKKTVVWDWKFGQGVPVSASYKREDQEGNVVGEDGKRYFEFGNDQLMFYARAALYSYPEYFDVDDDDIASWPVELVICQPRILDEELSTYTSNAAELHDFGDDLVDAVEEALSGKGSKAKGSYCRFAKCKSICPLHLNGAEALAEIGSKLNKLQMHRAAALDAGPEQIADETIITDSGNLIDYPTALSMMLELAETLEPYLDEARKQAHVFMENGGQVPGHKLVPKKAGWDSFPDEQREEVDGFLSRRKLSVEERRKPWSPVTPAVARKLLKAKGDEKGLKLLEKYVKPGVSSGTTIARNDDPRPEVKATSTMIGELANKIASIGGQ